MSTNVGWGVHGWGPGPWGGYVAEDQPPLPIGDFERIYRESRFKHEQETIRNVLFKVDGVEAEALIGVARASGGRGNQAWLWQSLRMRCGVGAVEIATGTGTEVPAAALRSYCDCGEAEAGAGVMFECDGVMGESAVGDAKVRAIRNPTDEDLLMMIAEML